MMVGPLTDEERSSFTRRLKAGLVVLVGLSAGLITVQGDAEPVVVAGAFVGGVVVGSLLIWYVFPDMSGLTRGRR
jgi:membrane associated rhomboid family serine protease